MLQKWMIRNISDDRTMLHEACEFGHLNIVKFLIENGADINVSYITIIIFLIFIII